MLTKAAPRNQSLDTSHNVVPISDIFSLFNIPCLTILTITLANTQLLIFPDIFLILKTFFINARPISDLNNRPLSKKPLKTIFSNIWQKQYTMHRRKVPNLYEVVIDFSLSNIRSILINSSFKGISFISNRDNQENSTPKTIYKNSN